MKKNVNVLKVQEIPSASENLKQVKENESNDFPIF